MQKGRKTERFGIEQLFGSKTRSRLLQLFLNNSTNQYFVRELTRKIDAQLNSVRRELNNLVELGVCEEMDEVDGPKRSGKSFIVSTPSLRCSMNCALFTKASVLIQQDLVRVLVEEQPFSAHPDRSLCRRSGRGNGHADCRIAGCQSPQARMEAFERDLGARSITR